MKTFLSIFILLLTSCNQTNENKVEQNIASTCEARGCSGSDYCSACKNCTGCKHCAKQGGSCGVCKKPSKKKKR